MAWLTGQSLSAQPLAGYSNPTPFLQRAALSGFSSAELQALFTPKDVSAETQAATYPQSVASGDPRPNGVVLWTRVAGNSGDIIAWQIATDSTFSDVLVNGTYTLTDANDFTVKIPVLNSVLAPYTTYSYTRF